jgi:hypothetical protein
VRGRNTEEVGLVVGRYNQIMLRCLHVFRGTHLGKSGAKNMMATGSPPEAIRQGPEFNMTAGLDPPIIESAREG